MDSARPYHLLALSDLHLGCDLKLATPSGDARRAPLDRALVQFLDCHAARREGGKPWRLILAGDIFDFVAITTLPAPAAPLPFAICAEERELGLAAEEEKCVWKLRRIAARHDEVFLALSRFLAAGNEVHFIRGNHDAELQFPSVQAELARLLTERAGPPSEALRARVRFHAWFYLEPGLLYMEHGNAHDRYCLQSGFFDEAPAARGELELPMSSKVLRYFASRWAGTQEDVDRADQMNLREYIGWIFRMGRPLAIAIDYFAMVARVMKPAAVRAARIFRARVRAPREASRLARVQGWLERFSTGDLKPKAAQLLATASEPAEHSLFATAQLFYVDRLALLAAALLAATAALSLAPGLAKLAALALVAALFALGNQLLARLRRCDAHLLLRAAAERLAGIFPVRAVVMGHSHVRVDEPLRGGARYLNLGSWTPGCMGLSHLVVVGEEAELRSFVYKPIAQPGPQAPPGLEPRAA